MAPRTKKGFTLIELLIVVVIIGILASIAIPSFKSTKGKAYAASIRSDLRNLATAEEAYMYDNGVYTTDQTALKFIPSAGVTITISEATAGGWSASGSHPLAPESCAVFFGSAAPLAPATSEGLIACQ
ncbi:MAG TPA: prepilin-type N-terminal cleavage/methylation domain-containing protein [Gemmatimonadaceae bacterium]|nr:prepilin-type N-terminal cleavage/methylation domain-containing protein [Gemmatimonadaceae bacterium]